MPEDWFNGNKYTPFTVMMRLERIDDTTFKSTYPSYSPGGSTRAYGGHVFAQSAWAAAQVVKTGFIIHNVTGYFILQAFSSKPYIYKVRMLREGGGFCQLQVDAYQDQQNCPCFTCLCSFKRPEPSSKDYQQRYNLREKYAEVLGDKRPDSFPEIPGVDSPYFVAFERQHGTDPFPGLAMRKVDMAAWNGARPPLAKRQLHWYRALGALPPAAADPNLHACAHLFASDRNSLFPVPNFLGVGDGYSAIATLSHAVVFHGEGDDLAMTEPDGTARWFCQEFRVERVGHGRALVTSRIWREDGLHVASQSQDGLLRMGPVAESASGGVPASGLPKKKPMTAKDIFGYPTKKEKL